jgi:peptidoglycan/LPS O-acetylase OafA/YrhL
VDLFFAISGFVVATSFVPQLDLALDKSSDYPEKSVTFVRHTKAFFVRRFMRIMPALVFALLFYISLGLLTDEPTIGSLSGITPELFAIFTYTHCKLLCWL